jgi:hypothetical protein
MSIKVGDKVSFHAGRRGKQVGVVASFKHPVRKMTRKLENIMAHARLMGVSLPLDKPPVALVDVDGGVWTVSVSSLTVVGKGDAAKAQENSRKQLLEIRDAKDKASRAAWDTIDSKGLNGLKPGDMVNVHYTYYPREEAFVKFSSSGNVGIKCTHLRTGVRYIHPKFVDLVTSKG